MNRRFTPFEMRILLWYYACAENPTEFRKSSAWDDATYTLQQLELIAPAPIGRNDRNESSWQITARGKALVEKILEQTLPVQRWVFE